jgi:hypothetical protein
MDIVIAPSSLPFKWNGKYYRIVKAGIANGTAYAETDPDEHDLEVLLRDRIQKDQGLKVYLASGYVCFIEDFGK